MNEKSIRLPDISRSVPVFPLPDVVLFPHAHLPLHIFEPRYRKMVEDIVEQPPRDRLLAMGTLMETSDDRTLGDPPVFNIVGVGRVVDANKLPDGRYILVLQGIGRARLLRELDNGKPYREFMLEWVEETIASVASWRNGLATELKALALHALREGGEKFREMINNESDLSALVDQISAYMPFSVDFKLVQLANPNVLGRTAHVIAELEARMSPARNKRIRVNDEPEVN
ncbi:Lon protease [Planctomycetaceae bacterium]|nr:Lon protease [Planctomycetaceae bacterium]